PLFVGDFDAENTCHVMLWGAGNHLGRRKRHSSVAKRAGCLADAPLLASGKSTFSPHFGNAEIRNSLNRGDRGEMGDHFFVQESRSATVRLKTGRVPGT